MVEPSLPRGTIRRGGRQDVGAKKHGDGKRPPNEAGA
ncbi:Hypothetical protein RM25_0816 [Propionibacterium freudenreichii subsp. freudenreichii]|nr:Hypothetical protein RM25_0816 [Propionibacterium freudenreichii subsp. freudenreichii]